MTLVPVCARSSCRTYLAKAYNATAQTLRSELDELDTAGKTPLTSSTSNDVTASPGRL